MNSTATAAPNVNMTAEEFLRDFGDMDGVELVRGQLVRLPMPGFQHGDICVSIISLLVNFVKPNDLGRIASNDTFVRVSKNPDSYRGPDVLYISYDRLPREQQTPAGPLEVPPELVVEVRSPSDSLKQIMAKGQEYLDAGVTAVIIIDPETESLGVFRPNELPQRFSNGDTVTLPDVLPGFSAPAKAFFG